MFQMSSREAALDADSHYHVLAGTIYISAKVRMENMLICHPDGAQDRLLAYCGTKGAMRLPWSTWRAASGCGSRRTAFLDHYPEWSPDGKRIAFISDAEGLREIRAIYDGGGRHGYAAYCAA